MLDRLNWLLISAYTSVERTLRREDGQALTEYALVLAVIVIGLIAVAMTPLRTGIGVKIGTIVTSITGAS
jgi:Flp pilus assembly pilin Flp